MVERIKESSNIAHLLVIQSLTVCSAVNFFIAHLILIEVLH